MKIVIICSHTNELKVSNSPKLTRSQGAGVREEASTT